MGDIAMSPPIPSLDGTTSKVITVSTQIMVATVVVLFFVIAFCFFLHLYFKCFYTSYSEDANIVAWRRQMARQRGPSSVPPHRRGLDPVALRSLPIVVYNPKDFKDGLECAVCLSEVSEGEKARILPKCNHGFHVECIDMWFKSHSTCPLCRDPVVSSSNESNDTTNGNNADVQDDRGSYSSESEYYSDSDDNSSAYGSARLTEIPVFPTNVLFWGNDAQVSSFGQAAESSAASSSGVSRPRDHELVIDIPTSHHEFCEDCLSSLSLPPPAEEVKTPVMSRLRSLRRLLSGGKRVTPSPSGSTSRDVDQQV